MCVPGIELGSDGVDRLSARDPDRVPASEEAAVAMTRPWGVRRFSSQSGSPGCRAHCQPIHPPSVVGRPMLRAPACPRSAVVRAKTRPGRFMLPSCSWKPLVGFSRRSVRFKCFCRFVSSSVAVVGRMNMPLPCYNWHCTGFYQVVRANEKTSSRTYTPLQSVVPR